MTWPKHSCGLREVKARFHLHPEVAKNPGSLIQSFPGVLSTPCHLVIYLYADAENTGRGISGEVAFRMNRICVLIPDLSLAG